MGKLVVHSHEDRKRIHGPCARKAWRSWQENSSCEQLFSVDWERRALNVAFYRGGLYPIALRRLECAESILFWVAHFTDTKNVTARFLNVFIHRCTELQGWSVHSGCGKYIPRPIRRPKAKTKENA